MRGLKLYHTTQAILVGKSLFFGCPNLCSYDYLLLSLRCRQHHRDRIGYQKLLLINQQYSTSVSKTKKNDNEKHEVLIQTSFKILRNTGNTHTLVAMD